MGIVFMDERGRDFTFIDTGRHLETGAGHGARLSPALARDLGIIAVMDQLAGDDPVAVSVAVPQRYPQRDQHQVGDLAGGRVPGHDPLGEHVEDERDVHQAGPGPHDGEVGHPDPVGRGRGEVTLQQVAGPRVSLSRDRGAYPLGSSTSFHAKGFHGPVDGAASHVRLPRPAQQGGHLAPPSTGSPGWP